jgi:hypothetical protein
MVMRLLEAVQALAVTFWVGTLWSAGLLVAPLLFVVLEDRAVAGTVAGRIFEATAIAGLACGALILALMVFKSRADVLRQLAFWLVMVMLALLLIGQFGLQPVMATLREQAYPQPVMSSEFGSSFAAWHVAARVIYLLQCLLGAALVISGRLEVAGGARR